MKLHWTIYWVEIGNGRKQMDKTKFIRCLKRIRSGDMGGLLPIFSEYYEELKITAKRILHNDSNAEDAASTVLIKLIQYAETTEHPRIENPGAYLYAMVKYTATDIYRADKRIVQLEPISDYVTVAEIDNTEALVLEQAFDLFEDKDFQIATMYYFYGYKLREIAVALGMPEGTVKWRFTRIKEKLAEFFEKIKKF